MSQIWSLICLPSMLIIRAPNSTPMVKSCTGWNRLSVNCKRRQDLPTPETKTNDYIAKEGKIYQHLKQQAMITLQEKARFTNTWNKETTYHHFVGYLENKTCGLGSLFRGWSGGSKSLWCQSYEESIWSCRVGSVRPNLEGQIKRNRKAKNKKQMAESKGWIWP